MNREGMIYDEGPNKFLKIEWLSKAKSELCRLKSIYDHELQTKWPSELISLKRKLNKLRRLIAKHDTDINER